MLYTCHIKILKSNNTLFTIYFIDDKIANKEIYIETKIAYTTYSILFRVNTFNAK